MLLIQVGCALVILAVLVNVGEQKLRHKVCLRIPPVLDKPRTLKTTELSSMRAAVSALKRSWISPTSVSVSTIKFADHVVRLGRCLKPGKRDVSDAAKADGRAESSRNKRSVCPCRKDYRQLTKTEMKDFHKGLKKLKNSGIYDELVELHNVGNAPAAHFGAAFLPWHREYLYQLEQKIKDKLGKDGVRVPFWDSAMEEALPDPRDCVVWTKQFWGPSNGQVNQGKLAKKWTPTPGCGGPFLLRSASSAKSLLLTRQKYSFHLLPFVTFTQLALHPIHPINPPTLDGYHGQLHGYVGGTLNNLICAPNDPIFFLLHAMIDCVWEEWSKQPGRVNTYPLVPWDVPSVGALGGPQHRALAPMEPFGLQNIDGLTWGGYTCCAKRPSLIQCTYDDDCDSPQGLLFCHSCQCHCKVKEGGDCTGFEHNACYCKKANKTPRCLGGASKKCYCI